MVSVIETQRRLLGDAVRNRAFAEAIGRAVRPGRTRVADLGTGTGFLAILCARAGARHVWACEVDAGLARLARQVIAAHGAAVEVVHGHSTRLAPPAPVDLIVAEIFGHIATEEHLIESLVDARRWLAPGGRVIPRSVTQWLCPVIAPEIDEDIDVFHAERTGEPGIDLALVRQVALQNAYVRRVPPAALLAAGEAAQAVDRLRFPGQEASRRRGRARWSLPATTIYGWCLWWEAELWEGVRLSTSPLAPPTHWEQVYLPLLEPLRARTGDSVACELVWDTRWDRGCALQWRGTLRRGAQELVRFAMDNRIGVLPA
ncbi:MAG: class I SAM-dependent methyltransferase [Planctomycetota bacterium]|nr:class I SAM-dependent methyltransferase [Planctomycetota bacterium]MCX8040225.1 class I SAM-dependent methyltransferase [Planctomycetota bacterium]MDW8372480.1 class I SAM-dependent methyltransferase [Planctomycetota bacterium]